MPHKIDWESSNLVVEMGARKNQTEDAVHINLNLFYVQLKT